jgi:hypothetical protein
MDRLCLGGDMFRIDRCFIWRTCLSLEAVHLQGRGIVRLGGSGLIWVVMLICYRITLTIGLFVCLLRCNLLIRPWECRFLLISWMTSINT